jgi:hypothetical protein
MAQPKLLLYHQDRSYICAAVKCNNLLFNAGIESAGSSLPVYLRFILVCLGCWVPLGTDEPMAEHVLHALVLVQDGMAGSQGWLVAFWQLNGTVACCSYDV